MKTNVEITKVSRATVDEKGYANYAVTFRIGEHELTVPAYCRCGWLKPDSDCDFDGGGLAVDYPGGWSVCDGDESTSTHGRLLVDAGGEHFDSIMIDSDSLTPDVFAIPPSWVPEWEAAVNRVIAIEEGDYALAERESVLELQIELSEEIRNELAKRLDALCREYVVDCPEPSPEEVYEYLDDKFGIDELGVQMGDYRGCGFVVAWRGDRGCDMAWHPNTDRLPEGLNHTVFANLRQMIAWRIMGGDDRIED